MDVICERCGTEYEFDATLVSEFGTSVKCTSCGHVFKVFRTTDGSVASALKPWQLRLPSGEVQTVNTLRELQRLITEGKLPHAAEITRTGDNWKRLDSIVELETFFAAARAASSPGVEVAPHAPGGKPASLPPRPPPPTRISTRPSATSASEVIASRRPQSASRVPTLPPPGLDPSVPPPPESGQPTRPQSKAPVAASTVAWDNPAPPASAPPAAAAAPQNDATLKAETLAPAQTDARTGATVAWDNPAPAGSVPPPQGPAPSVPPRVSLRAAEADLAGSPREQGRSPVMYTVIGVGIGAAVAIGAMVAMRPSTTGAPQSPTATAPAATTQPDPLAALAQSADAAAPTAEPSAAPTETPPSSATENQAQATTPAAAAAQPAQPPATSAPAAQSAIADSSARPSTAVTTAQATRPQSNAGAAASGAATGGASAPAGRDFEFYVDRGRALVEAGDTRGARAHFEQALRMRPGDADALVGLGWVAANTERYQEAIDHFRAAASHGSVEAYVGLGQMYRSLGRRDDALEAYNTYLERSPNGSYARLARRWVEQMSEERPPGGASTPSLAVDPSESQTQ